MKQKLLRICEERERYYDIHLYKTLFGEFCIERIYGATRNKKPTGMVREFFEAQDEALSKFTSIMKAKISKGYVSAYKI